MVISVVTVGLHSEHWIIQWWVHLHLFRMKLKVLSRAVSSASLSFELTGDLWRRQLFNKYSYWKQDLRLIVFRVSFSSSIVQRMTAEFIVRPHNTGIQNGPDVPNFRSLSFEVPSGVVLDNRGDVVLQSQYRVVPHCTWQQSNVCVQQINWERIHLFIYHTGTLSTF